MAEWDNPVTNALTHARMPIHTDIPTLIARGAPGDTAFSAPNRPDAPTYP